jgi:hypothetical protein
LRPPAHARILLDIADTALSSRQERCVLIAPLRRRLDRIFDPSNPLVTVA